jgi:hypothetical protein
MGAAWQLNDMKQVKIALEARPEIQGHAERGAYLFQGVVGNDDGLVFVHEICLA